MYVLDTNTLIYYFKGMGEVAKNFLNTSPNDLGIPTIVLFEIYVGIAKSGVPQKRIEQLHTIATEAKILPFTQAAAERAAQVRVQLEHQGQPIGPLDILIAGIALSQSAVLVTHNLKEFSRVPNLKIIDWF